ncbi:MAG: ABC transporter ATP-binding protein [Candidatus Thorarchaeota archaeon]
MSGLIDKKEKETLIEVTNLRKYFPVEHGTLDRLFTRQETYVKAVDDITFSINKGEIFCLVGESGCGKTTTANILVGLETPTTGKFKWKNNEITHNELIPRKGNIKSQVVFQNPFSSLNPRMRLGDAVLHPLLIHNRITDTEVRKRYRNSVYSEFFLILSSIISLLALTLVFFIQDSTIVTLSALFGVSLFTVALGSYFYHSWFRRRKIADSGILEVFEEIGLTPSQQYYTKFPHEVSGGELQRASIARALILNPELIIADEPTSMLDVSLRAGILDSLKSLQLAHNLSILFITHDLATARHFGDRIGVMYVGKLVEMGEVEAIFRNPLHPYTRALIDAVPTPIPGEKKYDLPHGEVPDAINPPSGCRFHPRCPIVDPSKCIENEPELIEQRSNHWVACHFPLIE